MRRWILGLGCAIGLLTGATGAIAQSDSDEVIEEETGVRGYGVFSVGALFPVFGEMYTKVTDGEDEGEVLDTAKITSYFLPVLRLDAFITSSDLFHAGLYFQIARGTGSLDPEASDAESSIAAIDDSKMTTMGFGIALKTGFRLQEKILFGFEADVGAHFFKLDEWDELFVRRPNSLLGLELAPVVFLQFDLYERDGKIISMPVRLGTEFVPLAVERRSHVTYRGKTISIFATVGITLGT